MRRALGPLAFALMSALFVACGGDEADTTLAGMVRTPTPTISVPAVVDAGGEGVAFPAPATGLALVYFGYTYCPDICPTTLADLRWAIEELGGDTADRLALTFVSVDPERDTQELLDAYVASFVADGRGLRLDDPAALRSLADAFGADYSRDIAADGTVEVGHTAFLYALDQGGRLLVQWPFGTTREELRDDLHTLLDQLETS